MTLNKIDKKMIDDSFVQDVENVKNTASDLTTKLAETSYSITSFGAKGDGVADDTQSIQNAIDHLDSVGGGTLLFPRGVYRIASQVSDTAEGTISYKRRRTDGIRLKGNIRYKGNNATLLADPNCAFIFTQLLTPPSTPDAPVAEVVKNIVIEDLAFKKDTTEMQPFYHSIQIENCRNLTIQNCEFKGWGGDAICLGTQWMWNTAEHPYDDWARTVIENVRILNCDFDGVSKNNRQGISIVAGEDILIDRCNFKNMTGVNMPGAIDIEPDRPYHKTNNIHISNCTFDNIGAGNNAGVICFPILEDLDKQPGDFSVKNCTIKNSCRAYFVQGTVREDGVITSNTIKNVEFSGNTIENCYSWFSVGSADNVTIRDENVSKTTNTSWVNQPDFGTENNVSRFYLLDNTVKDVITTNVSRGAPIYIHNTIEGGVISGNRFIDTVLKDVPNAITRYRVFSTDSAKHKNIYYGDNIFLNTGLYPLSDTNSLPFIVPSPLVNGERFVISNNKYIGLSNYTVGANNIYASAKLGGKESETSVLNSFNATNHYSIATLPYSVPLGITSVVDGVNTVISFKQSIDPAHNHYIFQIRFTSDDRSKMFTRGGNIGVNTWAPWKTFSGV